MLLRSCFKTPQLARYSVINRFEMLIYSHVNCAFSSIYALSRTHLRGFKTASKGLAESLSPVLWWIMSRMVRVAGPSHLSEMSPLLRLVHPPNFSVASIAYI